MRVFNVYQIALGSFLLTADSILNIGGVGEFDQNLFQWAVVLYLTLVMACIVACKPPERAITTPASFMITLDIVVVTCLVHASGGVTSGFGVLMIPSIAAAGLLMNGRLAFFFASIASLALLLDQVLADQYDLYVTTAYTQTGLLGAALMASAVAASMLSSRSVEQSSLAETRGRKLAEMSTLNRIILERMPSGIILLDDTTNLKAINEAALGMLRSANTEAGTPLSRLSLPLYRRYVRWLRSPHSHARQTLDLPDGKAAELRFLQLTDASTQSSLIQIDDAADINHRIQATKLSALGRLSASIAHEIRNPLGAISHAAQLLRESEELQKSDQRLVEIINDQVARMNAVIGNVLSIYRRDPPTPTEMALPDWIADLLQEFRTQHKLVPAWGELSVQGDITRVIVDPNHLRQVLLNLLKNALDHAKNANGSADVSTHLHPGRERENTLWLDILDGGPGIRLAERGLLFEPFHSTSSQGTGLGLYLARELCEMNQARLSYQPRPQGGSCFRIELPCATTVPQ